jgi:hypothetical protein
MRGIRMLFTVIVVNEATPEVVTTTKDLSHARKIFIEELVKADVNIVDVNHKDILIEDGFCETWNGSVSLHTIYPE